MNYIQSSNGKQTYFNSKITRARIGRGKKKKKLFYLLFRAADESSAIQEGKSYCIYIYILYTYGKSSSFQFELNIFWPRELFKRKVKFQHNRLHIYIHTHTRNVYIRNPLPFPYRKQYIHISRFYYFNPLGIFSARPRSILLYDVKLSIVRFRIHFRREFFTDKTDVTLRFYDPENIGGDAGSLRRLVRKKKNFV